MRSGRGSDAKFGVNGGTDAFSTKDDAHSKRTDAFSKGTSAHSKETSKHALNTGKGRLEVTHDLVLRCNELIQADRVIEG